MTDHTDELEQDTEQDTEQLEDTAGLEHDEGGTATDDDAGDEQQPDTFSREYVAGLRREAAQHRRRATEQADAVRAIAAELWTARVAAAGTLADPSDLPPPADLEAAPTDEDVAAAVSELLERKPHLARRRVVGSIGQGAGTAGGDVSLSTLLRQGT